MRAIRFHFLQVYHSEMPAGATSHVKDRQILQALICIIDPRNATFARAVVTPLACFPVHTTDDVRELYMHDLRIICKWPWHTEIESTVQHEETFQSDAFVWKPGDDIPTLLVRATVMIKCQLLQVHHICHMNANSSSEGLNGDASFQRSGDETCPTGTSLLCYICIIASLHPI